MLQCFRDVLRTLFADTLKISGKKFLSLSEMLAESSEKSMYDMQVEKEAQKQLQAQEVSTHKFVISFRSQYN